MPPPTHAQLRSIKLDGSDARSRGARHPPGRRHGLEPGVEGAVLHRKSARLAVRGHSAGQAQPARRTPARTISASPIAMRATSPTRNSVGAIAATSSPSRSHCSGRTRRRSACASTPATCSRAEYRDAILIARHGSWNKTQEDRRRHRRGDAQQGRHRQVGRSRSSPASSRTTTISAARSTSR